MVTAAELVEFLNKIAPPNFAEDYDNVGLLIGNPTKSVHKLLITLDVDEAVANEAKEIGADFILSHHPLIFEPIRRITGEDGVSKTILSLIENQIGLASVHTNFDSVEGGLGDAFLDNIAETTCRTPLDGDDKNGIGRIATLKSPCALKTLLAQLKDRFSVPDLRYVGDENRLIQKIAVVNGGGASYVYAAKEQGADCFISGDFKYHHARFAYENHMAMVEIPHYFAEIIFCDYMKELLSKQFQNRIALCVTKTNTDVWKTVK